MSWYDCPPDNQFRFEGRGDYCVTAVQDFGAVVCATVFDQAQVIIMGPDYQWRCFTLMRRLQTKAAVVIQDQVTIESNFMIN